MSPRRSSLVDYSTLPRYARRRRRELLETLYEAALRYCKWQDARTQLELTCAVARIGDEEKLNTGTEVVDHPSTPCAAEYHFHERPHHEICPICGLPSSHHAGLV